MLQRSKWKIICLYPFKSNLLVLIIWGEDRLKLQNIGVTNVENNFPPKKDSIFTCLVCMKDSNPTNVTSVTKLFHPMETYKLISKLLIPKLVLSNVKSAVKDLQIYFMPRLQQL